MSADSVHILSAMIVFPIVFRTAWVLVRMIGMECGCIRRSKKASSSTENESKVGQDGIKDRDGDRVHMNAIFDLKFSWNTARVERGWSIARAGITSVSRLFVNHLLQPIGFFVVFFAYIGELRQADTFVISAFVLARSTIDIGATLVACYSNPAFLLVKPTSDVDGEQILNIFMYVAAINYYTFMAGAGGFGVKPRRLLPLVLLLFSLDMCSLIALIVYGTNSTAQLPPPLATQYSLMVLSLSMSSIWIFRRILPLSLLCQAICYACQNCWKRLTTDEDEESAISEMDAVA